jgi:sulfoxide reductase heme-binding subunit YedZ
MTPHLAATLTATWLLTRASGAVSLVLLTAGLTLGVVNVSRWRARAWPRFVIDALHRNLALLAVTFVLVHVASSVLDQFVSIGILDALVPFAGSYQTLWLGLGALAFDLLLALVLTGLLRQRIGHRLWRATHWLAYACWPIAVLHTLGIGSDASHAWMLALTLGCIGAVAVAVVGRLALAGGAGRRTGTATR